MLLSQTGSKKPHKKDCYIADIRYSALHNLLQIMLPFLLISFQILEMGWTPKSVFKENRKQMLNIFVYLHPENVYLLAWIGRLFSIYIRLIPPFLDWWYYFFQHKSSLLKNVYKGSLQTAQNRTYLRGFCGVFFVCLCFFYRGGCSVLRWIFFITRETRKLLAMEGLATFEILGGIVQLWDTAFFSREKGPLGPLRKVFLMKWFFGNYLTSKSNGFIYVKRSRNEGIWHAEPNLLFLIFWKIY